MPRASRRRSEARGQGDAPAMSAARQARSRDARRREPYLPGSMRAPASPPQGAKWSTPARRRLPLGASRPSRRIPMQQAVALSSPPAPWPPAQPAPKPCRARGGPARQPRSRARYCRAEAVPPAAAPAAIPAPGNARRRYPPATPSLAAAAHRAAADGRHQWDAPAEWRRGRSSAPREAPPSRRRVKRGPSCKSRAGAAPEVVEHYLKQGRIDEAEKFDKWARSGYQGGQMAAQEGVHAYMSATTSFLDHMVDSTMPTATTTTAWRSSGRERASRATPMAKVSGGQIVFRKFRGWKSYPGFRRHDRPVGARVRLAPERNIYDAGITRI